MIKCYQSSCLKEARVFWKFVFATNLKNKNGKIDPGNPNAEPYALWAWCEDHTGESKRVGPFITISEEEYIIHSVMSG